MSEKDFTFFSFVYQIISKKPAYIYPNTVQTLQFSLKKTKASSVKTEKKVLFTKLPQTCFLIKLNRNFSFIEFLSKNTGDACPIINENKTRQMATLPTGKRALIEFSVTIAKLSHYRNDDSNTLIHSIVDTYHPDQTESKNVYHQDMTQTNIF